MGYSHIESSQSFCQNDAIVDPPTHPPSILNVKLPNLPKKTMFLTSNIKLE